MCLCSTRWRCASVSCFTGCTRAREKPRGMVERERRREKEMMVAGIESVSHYLEAVVRMKKKERHADKNRSAKQTKHRYGR